MYEASQLPPDRLAHSKLKARGCTAAFVTYGIWVLRAGMFCD